MISGALVLAGGPAARMEILCNGRSRPGLPFGGLLRLIDFTLSNCFFSDIPHIGIVIDRRSQAMWPYLRQWAMVSSGKIDIQVLEPEQSSRGTASALTENLQFIEQLEGETVLVLSSDKVYQMDYRALAEHHEASGADATIAVTHLPLNELYSGMTVGIDSANRVIGFTINHGMGSGVISTGCYAFKKSVLMEYIKRDAVTYHSLHSLRSDVLPAMAEHVDVRAYPFNGYWRDIKSINHYYKANLDFLNGKVIPLHEDSFHVRNPFFCHHIFSHTNNRHTRNSIIGNGCVIEGYVENSILFPGTNVDRQAEVWDSIIMSGVSIGSHSVVDHCIIDENSMIGNQCYLGLGANFDPGRTSVTVLGKQVTVPTGTSIGRNCRIFSHTSPADITAKVVPAGTTVTPQIKSLNVVF